MMSTSTCGAARGAHDYDIRDTAKAKQRRALLAALREHGALTTGDIREFLGTMHPAGRVYELRCAGWDIETRIGWFPDSDGRLHRQASYVLREGTQP